MDPVQRKFIQGDEVVGGEFDPYLLLYFDADDTVIN